MDADKGRTTSDDEGESPVATSISLVCDAGELNISEPQVGGGNGPAIDADEEQTTSDDEGESPAAAGISLVCDGGDVCMPAWMHSCSSCRICDVGLVCTPAAMDDSVVCTPSGVAGDTAEVSND